MRSKDAACFAAVFDSDDAPPPPKSSASPTHCAVKGKASKKTLLTELSPSSVITEPPSSDLSSRPSSPSSVDSAPSEDDVASASSRASNDFDEILQANPWMHGKEDTGLSLRCQSRNECAGAFGP